MAILIYFLFTLSIVTSTNACDRCLHQTKAVPFSNASALSSGACGYGSSAPSFYNGHLAAAVPSIFKFGSGCGACFQVRCMDGKLCSKGGTQVIVTDLNKNTETDLVLSSRAFMAMANKGMELNMLKLGAANVEYKRRSFRMQVRSTSINRLLVYFVGRVPCDYKGKNLAVRVEESSQKLRYLAIKFLYQGGQTEIVAVDVAKVGSTNWSFLRRKSGAVWDTDRVPAGKLQFRLLVTAGYDRKSIWAKSVLPADWNAGIVYDSGVQIEDVAEEGCGRCD
ncbi:Barwin-like endoglucanase [Cynara cardunculus var. scolymus]|uniref:Barwin-like endoglucanase n=1 Tax=Cynara cardunculus var. scolymus TaxID=59895 RepID=A0A103XSG2_CYNCS|nr:Barwin-like endoglucanase [Cynara cardunculus var. scolymus]